MIAAVGLVESNSVNIVAAMLVSPLMVRVHTVPIKFHIGDTIFCRTNNLTVYIGL
jgi:uncharacterized membrane protein